METPDLAQLGGFIAQATSAGVLVPDESLEQHVRQLAGLPTKDASAPSVFDFSDEEVLAKFQEALDVVVLEE